MLAKFARRQNTRNDRLHQARRAALHAVVERAASTLIGGIEPLFARVGRGLAGSHHAEFAQGPLIHPYNPNDFVTAVVTVYRADRFSAAAFVPSLAMGPKIDVHPAWAVKSAKAARAILDVAGHSQLGGRLFLESNIETVGAGQGSTTSNCTAAARAAADSIDLKLTPEVLQTCVFQAEQASDPISLIEGHGTQVVYASRQNFLLERMQRPAPAAKIVGFSTDALASVVTENLIGSERYSREEASIFAGILRETIDAVNGDSIARLAASATQSCEANQMRVPLRGWRAIRAIADSVGALGVCGSHSGTVAGVIFPPDVPRDALDTTMNTLERELFVGNLHVFET